MLSRISLRISILICTRVQLLIHVLAVFAALVFFSCGSERDRNTSIDEIAANDEVARYMKAFQGQGEQSDGSLPLKPEDALSKFEAAGDLTIELVLAEPRINQPVFMNFDHRGRLWVVQYQQYPYPAGLKVTGIDNHDRVTFDKIPLPPPAGARGADKITFFEDADGDGVFEKATDAITGLNIATSVAVGRQKIWVLSPPYLLAYPDRNDDGIPEGDPEVHLDGFGIEDTHAVANSLRWGPDGWLYGAQGSTVSSVVNSAVTKSVSFSGQAIWRYHPVSRVFEVFAEGGGNTFYVEIDEKGRLYSGDNGAIRGVYFKQGGYYYKNWGKHGGLTNPFALGFLPGMSYSGDSMRFTHAWLRYQEQSLPKRYHGAMIAINPLHGYVQLSRFAENGSNFHITDNERILETGDRWFRPVDIKTGPDGAIYIADWYDSRLSHVNPLDNWHKTSGRIYRLSAKNKAGDRSTDLSAYATADLIQLLSSEKRWWREQARHVLGDRQDKLILEELRNMMHTADGQTALEALWAINLTGGFDDSVAAMAIRHADPHVRMWAIRLCGDANEVSARLGQLLIEQSAREPHAEVRNQLACTAKRLPAEFAIPIIRELLIHHDDSDDPDIPMFIWWALESKAEDAGKQILALFTNKGMWSKPVVTEVIVPRVMQRYAMAGGKENLSICASLLSMAPDKTFAKILIDALQEGLAGREGELLPMELTNALRPFKDMSTFSPELSLTQGGKTATAKALAEVADDGAPLARRLAYIRAFGKVQVPAAVPVLLRLVTEGRSSNAIIVASLNALQSYDNEEIGLKVLAAYPYQLRANVQVREAALSLCATRAVWAAQLLARVGNGKEIHRNDIPITLVQRMSLLNDKRVSVDVARLWPETQLAAAKEKKKQMEVINRWMREGGGDRLRGKEIYTSRCGGCHRLFQEGGSLGPDLTGYDRGVDSDFLLNIIDPNAYIREGYVFYQIETVDGRHLAGKVSERRGGSVVFEQVDGEKITLSESQIKKMEARDRSLMPERLLDDLSASQVRDFFAYVLQRQGEQ